MDEWPVMNSGMLKTMASLNSMYNQIGSKPVSGFDPYQTMVNRRKRQEDPITDQEPVVKQHNDSDIKALEEFCQQYGIVGFNCGTMSPKAALMFLKAKMGVRETENTSYSQNKSMLYG